MRRVDRSHVTAPQALAKLNPSGRTETDEATEFFLRIIAAQQKNLPAKKTVRKKKETFPFKAYKDKEVKKALESLFHGKCAYCEARYRSVQPVDIEHWRPKAEVIIDKNGTKRYGYYWLAADWDNLLPSCIDCNRVRKHYDFLEKEEITIGKGNWFPQADGCAHASCAKEICNEDPLLLNPYFDDPERYLEFREEGIVRPVSNADDRTELKAKASMRYYALNRDGLVRERLERIQLIKQKIQTIKDFARLLNEASGAGASTDSLKNSLRRELQQLNEYRNPEQPFSSMSKQIIGKLMQQALE